MRYWLPRECTFDGQTAAAGLGPVPAERNSGKGKKAAYLTPDYTYGHTVQKSMSEYLNREGGWSARSPTRSARWARPTTALSCSTSPPTPALDVFLNVNWGRDAAAVDPAGQKQFGVLDKQKLVVPYQVPFLAREVGGGLDGRRPRLDELHWWGRSRTSIRSPRCSTKSSPRSTAACRSESACRPATCSSRCGPRRRRSGRHLLPARDHQGLRGRARKMQSMVRRGFLPPRGPSARSRPVIIVRGKKKADMKGKGRLPGTIQEILPGAPLMQKPGRVRLQARRLHLRPVAKDDDILVLRGAAERAASSG